jgi:RNase adaptor protein for sRNA GlmZ degradation
MCVSSEAHLKSHTGEHVTICERVIWHPNFNKILNTVRKAFIAFMHGPAEHRTFRVATYCKSGRHRSVAVTVTLRYIFEWLGYQVQVVHWSQPSWQRWFCYRKCQDCQDNPQKIKNFMHAVDCWRALE